MQDHNPKPTHPYSISNNNKLNFGKLSTSQKISVAALGLMALTIPLFALLAITPIKSIITPATGPITSPTSPTPTTTITPSLSISPTPTVPPTPTSNLTPTPKIVPPTPTGSITPTPFIPSDNVEPELISDRFKVGFTGRKYSTQIKARDRNGDEMIVGIGNIPPGLTLGSCENKSVSDYMEVRCDVSGIPTTPGFYTSVINVKDVYGATSSTEVIFVIISWK